jgi:hypothetical protein
MFGSIILSTNGQKTSKESLKEQMIKDFAAPEIINKTNK